jgi:hypothetical protein
LYPFSRVSCIVNPHSKLRHIHYPHILVCSREKKTSCHAITIQNNWGLTFALDKDGMVLGTIWHHKTFCGEVRINMLLNGKGSYLPFREGTMKSFSHGSFVGVVKSPCLFRLTQFQLVMFPAKYWFHVCATSYWLHNLKATLNKGPCNKVQWDQAFLLVESFKLVPSPLDKGPRQRQFTLWFSLHGIILEGTPIGLDKKKSLKESSFLENQSVS